MKGRQVLSEDVEVVMVEGPVCQGSFVDCDHTLRARLQQVNRREVVEPVLQLSPKPVLCVDRRYAPGVWTEVYKGSVQKKQVLEEADPVIGMLSRFKRCAVVGRLQPVQPRRQSRF